MNEYSIWVRVIGKYFCFNVVGFQYFSIPVLESFFKTNFQVQALNLKNQAN